MGRHHLQTDNKLTYMQMTSQRTKRTKYITKEQLIIFLEWVHLAIDASIFVVQSCFIVHRDVLLLQRCFIVAELFYCYRAVVLLQRCFIVTELFYCYKDVLLLQRCFKAIKVAF